jgi:hypothetical protein
LLYLCLLLAHTGLGGREWSWSGFLAAGFWRLSLRRTVSAVLSKETARSPKTNR